MTVGTSAAVQNDLFHGHLVSVNYQRRCPAVLGVLINWTILYVGKNWDGSRFIIGARQTLQKSDLVP